MSKEQQDIVERLRDHADDEGVKEFSPYAAQALDEAAAEIERLRHDLRDERDRLGSALKSLHGAHARAAEMQERCAKVADQYAEEREDYAADEEDPDYRERFLVYARHVRRVATAIRSLKVEE